MRSLIALSLLFSSGCAGNEEPMKPTKPAHEVLATKAGVALGYEGALPGFFTEHHSPLALEYLRAALPERTYKVEGKFPYSHRVLGLPEMAEEVESLEPGHSFTPLGYLPIVVCDTGHTYLIAPDGRILSAVAGMTPSDLDDAHFRDNAWIESVDRFFEILLEHHRSGKTPNSRYFTMHMPEEYPQ